MLKPPRRVSENTSSVSNLHTPVQKSSHSSASVSEVRARADQLNQYAARLAEMERDIKQEREQFEEEYDAMLGDLADQEEQLRNRLKEIRQNKRQIAQRLNDCIHVSSSLLTGIAETRKQEQELTLAASDATLREQASQTDFALIPVDKLTSDIKTVQEQLNALEIQIQAESSRVKEITNTKSEASERASSVFKRKSDLTSQRDELLRKKEEEAEEISRQKAKCRLDSELLSINEIKLMAEDSLLRKRIDELRRKLTQREDEYATFQREAQPKREAFAKHNRQLEDIRAHTDTFTEALEKRRSFANGMEVAIERTNAREKEIAATMALFRNQLKKFRVDQFLLEEGIEENAKQEIELRKQLDDIDLEMKEFTREETITGEELEQISRRQAVENATDQQFQKVLDMTTETYQNLKDRVRKMRKEEQKAIKRLMSPKQDPVPSGPEIDEAQRRADVIAKGYEAQICHAGDQCMNLRKSIELEEMKVNLSKSEYKRIGSAIERRSTISFVSTKTETKSRLEFLQESIREVQQKISETRERLKTHRLSIMNKSAEADQIPNLSNNDKLLSIQAACEKRASIAEEFCKTMTSIIPRIRKSIDDWNSMSSQNEATTMKQWFQEISAMMDRVEDIEIRANIL